MNREITISHNDLFAWLSDTLAKIDRSKLTDAFLYSLSSGDLTYRACLASYIFASSIPEHTIDKQVYPSGNIACSYCGHCETCPQNTEDLESELKNYGGVRVDQVFGATYYLHKFLSLPPVKPSKKDFDIFNNIIDAILLSENNTKPRDLEKIFGKIFRSNKGQREMIIDQMGISGILETEEHKGFKTQYTPPSLRVIPPVHTIDWFYPVCWWRGKNKINFETYDSLFGHYPELKRV
ncbi:MAG: hypothetical protein QM781_06135 [Chitinophagaceae bacterium]